MFTGLIEDMGTVKKIENKGASMSILIECALDLTETKIGDSIAIDGVCLTVSELFPRSFCADVSQETVARTTFNEIIKGQKVNLERAMLLSQRLGGHLVLGHVDGVGKIQGISRNPHSTRIKISASENIMKYIIEKGSVAVDGISLTVNECAEKEFAITIIPFTGGHTTLIQKKIGDKVHIENDIIGKYVEKFLTKGKKGEEYHSNINMDFLHKHGVL